MLCVCTGFIGVGFLLYTAAFLSIGVEFHYVLFAALRGIFSTARMFSLSGDYGVLLNMQGTEWLMESIWMKILLWLCHISALIIIQTALLSLFGRKVMDEFRIRFGLHKEVYVIKGSNKNALLLGENIATKDKPRNRPDLKRLVVFLLEEEDDWRYVLEKSSHFGGIVLIMDRNRDLRHHLWKVGLGKRRKRRRKYHFVLMSQSNSVPDDAFVIAERAKDGRVPPENLDVFALVSSDWDREKIEEITQAKEKIEENEQRKYPYTFHIINEVELLAREMIKKHPPFESAGLEFVDGVATRDFTVMILGFGTVGQATLLRLIMNGQFLGSKMRAIVIDKEIDRVRDCFLYRHPAIHLCCDIEFKEFDVQCDEFYHLLNEIAYVDYVVISLASDEINKQLALDIRLSFSRKGTPAFPLIAVSEKKGHLHETREGEKIFIFGCREEIYKESVIIRDKTDLMAKAVHEVYGGDPPWHELEWFYQESNRASADFIPTMLHLANLTEDEVKDSIILTEETHLAEALSKTEKLRWNAFHAAMGYSPISIEEMRRRFEEYTGAGTARARLDFARRDSKTRLHSCLVSWDELDEVSKAYRELANLVDDEKGQRRDFKEDDRKIIENIPEFLRVAAKGQD